MNVFIPFGVDLTSKRVAWVNHTEKVKTLFEAILLHTDATRLDLQNRLLEQLGDNFFVREKKIFVHLSRMVLHLTFEEISELICVSKTSAHNLFSTTLSPKDSTLLTEIEMTYNNLLS